MRVAARVAVGVQSGGGGEEEGGGEGGAYKATGHGLLCQVERGETTRWKLPARRTGRPAEGNGAPLLPLPPPVSSVTALALDASAPPDPTPEPPPPPPAGREHDRSRRGESTRWKERARRTGVPHAGGSEGARCAGNEACEQLDPASPDRVYSLSESEAIARPW